MTFLKTDRKLNGRSILEFTSVGRTCRFIVLFQNENHDLNNNDEQQREIVSMRNINSRNNVIVIPENVDPHYHLIIIKLHSLQDSISICTLQLNKSQSYTINNTESLFKHNVDYFKQTHIINNKRYHSISKFLNSLNEVYLVCDIDKRMINYKAKEKETEKKTEKQTVEETDKVKEKDDKNYIRALNEIKAMELLKGNVKFVQLFDYHDDTHNQIFHIITKYCLGGDLDQEYKYLADHDQIFTESNIREYISQLFNILLDLDRLGIVHCDIKPSNIFIDGWSLILGDFGCCKFIDKSTITQDRDTNVEIPDISELKIKNEVTDPTIFDLNPSTLEKATRGTFGYISPEAKRREYAPSCDIFSIGSTILRLLCCHQEDSSYHQLFKSTGEIIISECRYSQQLIDFINRLLEPSPKNRESLQQLLQQYIETITENHSITFNVNTTFINNSTNITELKFGDEFNRPLEPNSLPPNLKSLSFGLNFNQQIHIGVLPHSLLHLTFGKGFNQKLVRGTLSNSLLSLVLGNGFNEKLSKGVLPQSLMSLTMLGYNQRLEIEDLPHNLEMLHFGSFNRYLDSGVLPQSLRDLQLNSYSHMIGIDVLPSSLQRIILHDSSQLSACNFDNFNDQMQISDDDIKNKRIPLPKSMESLVIGGYYNHKSENSKSLKIDIQHKYIYEASLLSCSNSSRGEYITSLLLKRSYKN
ncbi:hypothetical protein PPL_11613 [Heterostelium album PN500]|uniref:Protein kinase domain-containing protein n=1 Tax=Heterostelium pallidum (strain ATCC 26659 / Pp 5 / PN500) TaxID=670386 RepID=D3BV87_HETP5|nr:hypothetical protein PPL_11613 [Heterostelium album PN500]EFA74644.1 hypothetical protein PPL_11613 [Heterostelium album PN500]|eukprot:XP_020426778.1 hypothetical protein PPL_11613 [Heterostelium album PN500]